LVERLTGIGQGYPKTTVFGLVTKERIVTQ
jgi:hypothetical protein